MKMFIGQAIDAKMLEQETSVWPVERGAAMYDALVWAASGRRQSTIPSFTTRVNATDGGVDAEWSVDVKVDRDDPPAPFLVPGWNVFQYKQHDAARGRSVILAGLKRSLRAALAHVIEAHDGRVPDSYTLIVNLDLLHGHKAALREALLAGHPEPAATRVQTLGAAELAA